jgi:hypothetical protein
MGHAVAEMKPLWWLLRDQLLGSVKLVVDVTKAPVFGPGRGRSKTGYFWVIARDNPPWGGPIHLRWSTAMRPGGGARRRC